MKIRSNIVFILVIVSLMLLRFVNIQKIPLFWDEALYLNLADQIIKNPQEIFNSLNVVQLPIMIWIQALVHWIVPFGNPLVVGRVVLIVCDLISAVFIYKIGKYLKNSLTGYVAVVLYLSLPLTVFHSRVVMTESMVNMFTTFAVYLGIKHVKQYPYQFMNLRWIVLMTCIVIISFFTKPLAIVSYISILSIPLFFSKDKKRIFLEYLLVFMLAGLVSFVLFIPFIPKFSVYLINQGELTLSIYDTFKQNVWRIAWWTNAYLTLPVIVLYILSAWLIIRKKSKTMMWLLIWIVTIIVLNSITAARMFPRHIYPLGPPFVLACAYFITYYTKRKVIITCIIFLLLLASWKKDISIILYPEQSSLALEDTQQFFTDWTSGVGLKEVALFFNNRNGLSTKIFAGEDPLIHWGLPRIYNLPNTSYIKISDDLNKKEINQKKLKYNCNKKECFIILNKYTYIPEWWSFNKVFTYPKGQYRTIDIYEM